MLNAACIRNRRYRARKRLENPNFTRDLYRKNKDKIKQTHRTRLTTLDGFAKELFYRIRYKQKDTDITIKWIKNRLSIGKCELTNIKFDYSKHGNKAPKSPSIDRKDNSKGYFKNNCHIILTWLNVGRGNMPLSHFKQLLKEIAA